MTDGVIEDASGVARCWWCGTDPRYQQYHDTEWGLPVADDRRLFEKMCLEGFQAGLSWLTILRKREHFREVFRDFDIERVARFTRRDVERAVLDPGIVRHRGKIESAVNNARRTLEVIDELGSLSALLWSFEPPAASRPKKVTREHLLTQTRTDESAAMSKTLKRRGFSFVGPTTMYALMQSVGIVNDHLSGCARQADVAKTRRDFARPASPSRR